MATPISLKDVRQYMIQHHHQPLSIEYLAEIAGLSASYFI